MRSTLDKPVGLEPVDGVGHRSRVDLETITNLAERQLPRSRQGQQREHLEPAEVEAERGERRVDTPRQDLMGPCDRGRCRHGLDPVPASRPPVGGRLFDRVELQSHLQYPRDKYLDVKVFGDSYE